MPEDALDGALAHGAGLLIALEAARAVDAADLMAVGAVHEYGAPGLVHAHHALLRKEYECERISGSIRKKKEDNFVSRSLAAAVTPFYLIVPIKLDPLMPRFLDEDDALQRRDEFVGGAEPVVRGLALASLRQRHHYERRVRRVLR